MIVKGLIFVAVLIVAVLVYAATRPNTIRIERSAEVSAPPERVFALVNDLHQWPRWAPQDRDDPAMVRTFSGSASGVGAVSEWQGKGQSGKGRITIMESEPEKVVLVADWERPFVDHNVNTFAFQPSGAGTRVTWTFVGTNVYMLKVMGLFTSIDTMMGRHFEDGLNHLKAAAEQ